MCLFNCIIHTIIWKRLKRRRLDFFLFCTDTCFMDAGQTIFISSQLVLGAVAAFLAILLWPKIRDAAWMLIIFGTIVAYIETVYSVLKTFGISGDEFIIIGSVPLISFALPVIRMIFFIAAFTIMIYRQSRNR